MAREDQKFFNNLPLFDMVAKKYKLSQCMVLIGSSIHKRCLNFSTEMQIRCSVDAFRATLMHHETRLAIKFNQVCSYAGTGHKSGRELGQGSNEKS